MPNLTQVLRGKRPAPIAKKSNWTDKPYPRYKVLTALSLKDSIVEKKIFSRPGENCVPEVNQLLICLKDKDYNQAKCLAEINAYSLCMKTLIEAKRKDQEALNNPTSTAKGKLSRKVINDQLAKYPQPKSKLRLD